MKSFEDRLPAESAAWVSTGLISEPQRMAILARHPVTEAGGSRFVAILATVGGLLLATGVSLIVKANWEELGDWVKIGSLVALMLGAYGAGWQLKIRDGGYPKVGDVFLMVGALLFLLGIALVSQIFHLNARPATGLMVWWLGIVAVPWLTHSKGAQFVSLVALLVWLGAEMMTPGSWIAFGSRNEIAVFAVYFLLGLAVWFFGLALRGTRWEAFGGLHEKWGFLITGGVLYWLGFLRHFWRWSHHEPAGIFSAALALVVVLALIAGALAWRRSKREMKMLAPWLALGLVPTVAALVSSDLGDGGWLWSGLAWAALFVLSVMVIRAGLVTGREGWVNLGILFVAVNVVTRYFDLFGTMLEGGVFFIVTGALILALGIFLERKRRSLLTKLREGRA